MFDVEKARQRLERLARIDGPQTPEEAQESRELAQGIRLVETYGVDPDEIGDR